MPLENQGIGEVNLTINKLYDIENEAKDAGISGDALNEKRKKESYPVIRSSRSGSK